MILEEKEIQEQNGNGEYFEGYTIGDYLMSENGHQTINKLIDETFNKLIGQTVNRLIDIHESSKKLTLETNTKTKKWNLWGTVIIIIVVLLITGYLVSFDKFTTTVAVFFATLTGYLFGRRNN